ncbi:hypothetical protein BB558_006533 [Smittium angustum]|uniref:AAA+ ATPase domain-containing protein n=1 Tax=Smittium angustum TaxID=133377 RepID=A0A2U1IXF7_SMIAN|nr:hypothetical protein BB558_006800 [Smittium angustum]PVZ97506.1 hypothetical protein BB558_006533 [Smittium angustum]
MIPENNNIENIDYDSWHFFQKNEQEILNSDPQNPQEYLEKYLKINFNQYLLASSSVNDSQNNNNNISSQNRQHNLSEILSNPSSKHEELDILDKSILDENSYIQNKINLFRDLNRKKADQNATNSKVGENEFFPLKKILNSSLDSFKQDVYFELGGVDKGFKSDKLNNINLSRNLKEANIYTVKGTELNSKVKDIHPSLNNPVKQNGESLRDNQYGYNNHDNISQKRTATNVSNGRNYKNQHEYEDGYISNENKKVKRNTTQDLANLYNSNRMASTSNNENTDSFNNRTNGMLKSNGYKNSVQDGLEPEYRSRRDYVNEEYDLHNSGKRGHNNRERNENPNNFEYSNEDSKQNEFVTARQQMQIEQQKKNNNMNKGNYNNNSSSYGGGNRYTDSDTASRTNRQQNGYNVQPKRKVLGTGGRAKFTSPTLRRDSSGFGGDNNDFEDAKRSVGHYNSTTNGTRKSKPQDEGEDNEEVDERLKNVDPKMIEVIKNEIMSNLPSVSWEDIAGLEHAKKSIMEIVVWPMQRPDLFSGLRGPPKGLLLFGPPGTGKTLIGRCIASQSSATFFSISSSTLTSKWVGEGEKMVRALFAVARVNQPSVIFIDEIDSLLTQRTDGEMEGTRRIKTEFLIQFDGCGTTSEDDKILVIGATNRPQEIDEAARRRFRKRLYIPLPDSGGRKTIMENLLKKQSHCLTESEIEDICKKTKGYSGSDMDGLCREAALGPIRSIKDIRSVNLSDVEPVSHEHFIMALKQIRASVSQSDLQLYLDWDNSYGSMGIPAAQNQTD